MTRIEEVRKQRGLSQQALADRVGISRQAVGQYEAGLRSPTGDILVRISRELAVSSGYLLGMTDNPTREEKLPPNWEELVEEIMAEGLTPEDVRRALAMLRIALGKPIPGT